MLFQKELKHLKIKDWVLSSLSNNPLCVEEFLFNTGISVSNKRTLYKILQKDKLGG